MSHRPNWFIGWPFDGEIELVPDPVPPRVRRFAPSDRHVTSVFLGAVDEAVALAAWSAVEPSPSGPVDVTVGEVRVLGGKRPGAVAVLIDAGAPALAAATRAQRTRLVAKGLARAEDRPPLPHVTVARVQRSATDDERAAALAWAAQLSVRGGATLTRLALFTWAQDRKTALFRIAQERSLPALRQGQ